MRTIGMLIIYRILATSAFPLIYFAHAFFVIAVSAKTNQSMSKTLLVWAFFKSGVDSNKY